MGLCNWHTMFHKYVDNMDSNQYIFKFWNNLETIINMKNVCLIYSLFIIAADCTEIIP